MLRATWKGAVSQVQGNGQLGHHDKTGNKYPAALPPPSDLLPLTEPSRQLEHKGTHCTASTGSLQDGQQGRERWRGGWCM